MGHLKEVDNRSTAFNYFYKNETYDMKGKCVGRKWSDKVVNSPHNACTLVWHSPSFWMHLALHKLDNKPFQEKKNCFCVKMYNVVLIIWWHIYLGKSTGSLTFAKFVFIFYLNCILFPRSGTLFSLRISFPFLRWSYLRLLGSKMIHFHFLSVRAKITMQG